MAAHPEPTARRWVVVFNGARDSYQTPLALAERGRLEALVTDWYTPLDRPLVRGAARLLPDRWRSALARRHRKGLSSDLVDGGPRNAIAAIRHRGDVSGFDEWLGRRAGRLAVRRGAGLLAYSYYAHAAFSSVHADVPKLLFQVHPHPRSLASLYAEELRRVPEAQESLSAEDEARTHTTRFERLATEPHLAAGWITASSFTARTLVEQGIDADRVRVVGYGVDLDRLRPAAPPPRRPFRVLFVGQMTQRKGLSYLLEAWRQLALPDGELVLAGRGRVDRSLLARHEGRVVRREEVSDAELRTLYQRSHVFCMPSIAEGFGLVYLEALASGTPIIGTTHTGAADIIRDGQEGFILEPRDVAGLVARLRWCYDHPEELEGMRRAARDRAATFSWGAFRQRLADAVESLSEASDDTGADLALRSNVERTA